MNIGSVTIYTQPTFSPVQRANPEGKSQQESMGGTVGAENNSSNPRESEVNKSVRAVELTPAELDVIRQLKQADTAVRAHEMAHVAAGGRYVRSGARFQYERGPDGRSYAVAGEVSIDISKVPGDPKATAEKMDAVQRAALAPKDPSAQDRRIAAKAAQLSAEASMEYALLRMRENKALNGEEVAFQHQRTEKAYSSDGRTVETGTIINVFG